MKPVLTLLIVLFGFTLYAQECQKVVFHGALKDTTAQKTLYNLLIINKRTGRGVFGKPDGTFKLEVKPNDSIYFSVTGYKTIITKVIPDSTCSYEFMGYLELKEVVKAETVVFPIKSLAQLKEERENLAAVEQTRMVQGLQAFQSPITALYEQFSRRERMKQKLADVIHEDEMKQIVKEILRTYVSYDIIDLKEEEFDAFLIFLNINENFLKTASDYQLILFIKEKYIHFRKLYNPDYIFQPTEEGIRIEQEEWIEQVKDDNENKEEEKNED